MSQFESRPVGRTPLLFTSSGLGDHLVEGVRRELFEGFFAGPAEGWRAAQDGFHRHRWEEGRGHLSVNMARPDARTVSFAVYGEGAGAANPFATIRVERHRFSASLQQVFIQDVEHLEK